MEFKMINPLILFIIIYLLDSIYCSLREPTPNTDTQYDSDKFSEKLRIRTLNDNVHILLSYDFIIRTSIQRISTNNYHLFPKPIGEIHNEFPNINEWRLSLQSGRWRYRWGDVQQYTHYNHTTNKIHSSSSLAPPSTPNGGELYAFIHNHTLSSSRSRSSLDEWHGLQQALSGIYCASVNSISDLYTTTHLNTIHPHSYTSSTTSPALYYGVLPREALCTENLSPYMKLLPCRNKYGLASLLKSNELFDTKYHSMTAQYIHNIDSQYTELRHTFTVVYTSPIYDSTKALSQHQNNNDAGAVNNNIQWNLKDLFHDATITACPLSHSSELHIDLRNGKALKLSTVVDNNEILSVEGLHAVDLHRNINEVNKIRFIHSASLSDSPSTTEHKHLTNLSNHVSSSASSTPIQISRYITGGGGLWAQLNVRIAHNGNTHTRTHPNKQVDKNPYAIRYNDLIPWFLRIYMHTMKVHQNNIDISNYDNVLSDFTYIPAVHRGEPAFIGFDTTLNAGETLLIVISFEKQLLSINDYPPDVSRGFDIPSAIILSKAIDNDIALNSIDWSNNSKRVYTDGLLVLLPFPDFSMPFNVIAFTSTVVAFFFGSLFNALYSSDNEMLDKVRQNKLHRFKSKLLFLKSLLQNLITKIRIRKQQKNKNLPITVNGDPTSKEDTPTVDNVNINTNTKDTHIQPDTSTFTNGLKDKH